MELKRIELEFEVKEMTDEGKFVGVASTYDNVDLGGDVVRPGAFKKTLREQKEVPIFIGHDTSKMPVGTGALSDDDKGLRIEADLDMEDPDALTAFRKMKKRMMRGLSIGFSVVKDKILESGIRELLEVKVWEVSLTSFPMNPKALVTAVKQNPALTEPLAGTPTPEPPAPAPPAAPKSIEPEYHSMLEVIHSYTQRRT